MLWSYFFTLGVAADPPRLDKLQLSVDVLTGFLETYVSRETQVTASLWPVNSAL